MFGDGARAAGVGAGFRFGERPAAEFFALRQRHDVFLALRLGAKFVDVVGAERIVRGHDEPDGAIDARQLLDGDGVFDIAEAGAAVSFREDDAQQAEIGQLGNDFGGKLRGLVPFHNVRSEFRLREIAHGALELLLFVGEGEVHAGPRVHPNGRKTGARWGPRQLARVTGFVCAMLSVSHGSMRSARREGEKVNE